MKLYVNKKHRNISLITMIPTCLLFMLLMPYGSFDPGDYGFWLCIILTLSISFSIDFTLAKKWQKEYRKGDHKVDKSRNSGK